MLKLYKALGDSDQKTLVAFAEFLNSKAESTDKDVSETNTKNNKIPSQPVSKPLSIPRPDDESVIKAIKRLTATYPMVDKEQILHPISNLMTAHMMQGKPASAVIDELEIVFLNEYKVQYGDQTDSNNNKKSDK